MKITRRKLALALAGAGAAQAQDPQRNAPDEDLQAARKRLQAASAQLAQIEIPSEVDPAFQFKV